MNKKGRPLTQDMRPIRIDNLTIRELRFQVNETVEEIETKFPEYNDKDSFIVVEDGREDDDFSFLNMYFYREMTDEELEKHNREKNEMTERAVKSMKELIDRNFDEAVKYIEKKKSGTSL